MSHTEQLFSDAGEFESVADSASSISADQETTIYLDKLPADFGTIRTLIVAPQKQLACASNRHIKLAEAVASE